MFYRTLSPLGPQPCLLDFASPATLAMMAEKSNNSSTWTGPHERLVLEKGAKFQSVSVRPSVRPPSPRLAHASQTLAQAYQRLVPAAERLAQVSARLAQAFV